MPIGEASKQERLEQFERVCRGHGLPMTIQRRAVFEAVLEREDHPTADQVYDAIRSRAGGISRTTVYRILDMFVRLGLITKICHHGSAARFDPRIRQHHHLVCMHCEKIIDIEEERLDGIAWPDVGRSGFEIKNYHIHFRGVCADCGCKMKEGGDAARQLRQRSKTKRTKQKENLSTRKRRTKP